MLDDDQYADEEWLLSIGFKLPRDNPHCPFIFSGWGAADRYCIAYETDTARFTLQVHTPSDGMVSYALPEMGTRIEVRTLLSVLGIRW